MFAQLIPDFTPPPRRRIGRRSSIHLLVAALLAAACFTSARPAYANSFTATDTASLSAAINAANANPGIDTITLGADITLDAALPAITSDMIIQSDGTRRTVSGNDAVRVFRVDSGKVTFQNLTITQGKDVGGDGYTGYSGGGGGLGAGGGLYIDSGNVLVQNVTFSNNKAKGGAGAADSSGDGGKGGGSTNNATAGGDGATDSAAGADGQFGGGGGGGNTTYGPGKGGFGGGGGGGATISGGFGGGAGNIGSYGGAGGAGLGGALFIRTGTLTLNNNTFSSNSATGGQYGVGSSDDPSHPEYFAGDGQGIGGDIFICTSAEDSSCSAKASGAGNGSPDIFYSANANSLPSTTSLAATTQLTQQGSYSYIGACTGSYPNRNCTLAFTLKNTSGGQLQIRYEQITAISSHVAVVNGAPSPGGVNAVVNDVQSVANNATFQPTFNLVLTLNAAYTLRFKVYGYTGSSVAAAGADQAQAVELGEFEATVTPDAVGNVHLFLPVIQR